MPDECFRKEFELPSSEVAPSVRWEARPWGEHGEASDERQYRVEDIRARQNCTHHASKHGPCDRIIARFSYPSESLPPPVLSSLPPSAAPNAVGWTTSFVHHLKPLSTLFSVLMQTFHHANLYFKRYLFSLLFSIRPTVVEAPDPYINSKIEARIEAEKKHSVCRRLPDKVVRVITFVANEPGDASEKKERQTIGDQSKAQEGKRYYEGERILRR